MSSSRRHPLWRYLSYAAPYKWWIVLMCVGGVAKFTLPMIPAALSRTIVDDVINNIRGLAEPRRVELLWWIAGGMGVVAVGEAVAIFVRGYYTVKVSSSVAFDIRRDLWRHMQRLSLGYHQSRPTGTLLTRLMNDIAVSQQMVQGGIGNVVIDSGSGIIALIVLLSISWELTLIVLGVMPLYAILYRKLNPRLRQASYDVQEQRSVMSGSAVERLNGIALIQSFAQEKSEQRHFRDHAGELRGRSIRRGRLHQSISSLSNLLVAFGSAGVWVVGGYLAVRGRLTSGEIIQFTATAALLYLPIRRFSEINNVYQMSIAAIERVFEVFDDVPAVQDKPDVRRRSVERGEIEFDHVSFSYRRDKPPVLHDVSFHIEPGRRVAVVGESGAGKSTLVTLIPRLFDVTEGAIRIDGVDVRDYRLRDLRRSIGIVLQETILFSGTIRENLRYGRKDATEDEIVEAAKVANAHRFIVELPDGYDTEVGEHGVSLSGGQRQRVSLARAILQDPKVLILDEATSSLDSESENLIVEAMQRVMAGRTSLVIAHRLSTILDADRILVLSKGRLVEDGPHDELLARNGAYRHLFEQQFGPLQRMLSDGGR
ncbi:MAG: ABC transporter ATP-binding protein [Phycisphaerae bacterium]